MEVPQLDKIHHLVVNERDRFSHEQHDFLAPTDIGSGQGLESIL